MKITISQDIELKQGIAYMQIKEWKQRKDIQNFLKDGLPNSDEQMIDGINRYLRTLGIYKGENSFTELGKKVLKDGWFPQPSEGKYMIWYVENNYLLGNCILFFERYREKEDYKNLNKTTPFCAKNIYKVETEHNDWVDCEINEEIEIEQFVNKEQKSIRLNLTLELSKEDKYEAKISFVGYIIKSKSEKHEISSSLRCIPSFIKKWEEELLPDIIGQCLGDKWNEEIKCIEVPYSKIEKLDEVLTNFRISIGPEDVHLTSGEKLYVSLENVGVMPGNKNDANKWFMKLLEMEAEQDYLQEDDVKALHYLQDHIAFSPYKEKLDKIELNELISKVNKGNNKVAYWHLQAPEDLLPESPLQIYKDPITFVRGDKWSYKEIVSKMQIKDALWVGYYDKYVINEAQQYYVGTLIKTIEPKKSIIITNNIQNRPNDKKKSPTIQSKGSISYVQSRYGIPVKDIYEVYPNYKAPHDRVLVVFSKSGDVSVWALTNGITRFKTKGKFEDLSPETKIEVEDTFTITPVPEEAYSDFVGYLKKYFNGEK